MKYRKSEAQDYAKKNMRGVWVATYTPFAPDYKIDEEAFRYNIRHCVDLQVDGLFLTGLMGEGYGLTIAERKRTFEMAVEEANGKMMIMPYTSDPVVDNVVEMSKYSEDIGADLVTVINPKFYFGAMTEEGVYQYYKYIADRVNIAIWLFNQMEHGYIMSPRLLVRLAGIPNIVGVKHTGSKSEVAQTRAVCGNTIVVSDPSEEFWLYNLTTQGQEVMLAGPPPYTLQTKKLRLIKEYTDLAMKGEIAKAWELYKRLEPIRKAFASVSVPGKTHGTIKYWTQFLGMRGGDGRVRLPELELTEAEKRAIKESIENSELLRAPVGIR